MKKLLTSTALSLLLISTAGVSYGQAVICSPRTLIGGPNIVAELGICPAGYSRVGTTSSSGSSSAGGLFQNSVNDMVENARRNNERMAAEREAASQRAHEANLLNQQIQAQQQAQRRATAQLPEDSRCLRGTWDVTGWATTMRIDVAENGDIYLDGMNLSEMSAQDRSGSATLVNNNIYIRADASEGDVRSFSFRLSLSGQSLIGKAVIIRVEEGFFTDKELPPEEFELSGTRVSAPPAGCGPSIEPSPQSRNSSSPEIDRGETIADGLRNLSDLHRQGILTDEEFNAAKRRLLGL